MENVPFTKELYYSVSQLTKALNANIKTVLDRIGKGELTPDYVAPLTGKRFFLKESIQAKFPNLQPASSLTDALTPDLQAKMREFAALLRNPEVIAHFNQAYNLLPADAAQSMQTIVKLMNSPQAKEIIEAGLALEDAKQ